MAEMNRETLKKISKQLKCKIEDLLALDPKNDPFYTGSNAATKSANWLYGYWLKFGYSSGIHLRRLHYQLVSQPEPVLMPDGEPYENNNKCWKKLSEAAKHMRYLGYVDPNQLVDRRAPDTICHHFDLPELNQNPSHSVNSPYQLDLDRKFISSPFPDLEPLPAIDYQGIDPRQTYMIEIWCEKSTMNDILEPLCRAYRMNLVTGVGEMSVTKCSELVDRVKSFGKPTRIFYISDFDPAGESMPVAAARKIEFDARKSSEPLDIKLYKLTLTLDQIRQYNLPRNEIKETESRKDVFESRHGEGATELDALEAIYPGELTRIIQAAIAPYVEIERQNRMEIESYNSTQLQTIKEINRDVREPYKSRWLAIQNEFSELKDDFDQEFAQLMQSYEAKLNELLSQRKEIADNVEANLEEIHIDFPDHAHHLLQDEPEALLDTSRDYISQIGFYKKFKGIPAQTLTHLHPEHC